MIDNNLGFNRQHIVRLFETLPVVVWQTDAALVFTSSFGAALASIGLRDGEVVGRSVVDYLASGENGDLIAKKLRSALAGETVGFSVQWQGAHFVVALSPIQDAGGRIVGTMGIALETTAAAEYEAAIKLLTRAITQAEAMAPIGNFTIDLAHDAVSFSEQGRRLWGLPSTAPVAGKTLMERVHRDDRDRFAETRERAMKRGEPFSARLRVVDPTGYVREIQVFVSWMRDGEGRIVRSVGTIVDLSAQIEHELRIKHLSETDALTGLANRKAINAAIDAALGSFDRVAVALFDVDNFTRLNDGLGYAAGDNILRAVAERLRTLGGPHDTIARVGADEFVCVFAWNSDRPSLEERVRRFHEALEEPLHVDGLMLHLSMRMGVSAYPLNGTEDLLKKADIALYRTRRQPPGSTSWYTSGLERQLLAEQTLDGDLGPALAAGELDLYYQPIVDASSGDTVAHEALLRWHHPARGTLLPGAFLHLAEESNVVHQLNEWTIERAVTDCATRPALNRRGRKMHINVSPRQLLATDMFAVLARTLAKHGVDPASVALEVTEVSFLTDFEAARKVLRECRNLGAAIVVDDFGTGYNTFHYLRELPVDGIKIDRSFVDGLDVHGHSAAIVGAIVALAKSLEIAVVAEGVETAAQRDKLLAEGCHEMQGFLFAAGMPASALCAQ